MRCQSKRREEQRRAQRSDSHLELGGDVEFQGEHSCYGECNQEIPGVLLAICQSDITRKKSITHALENCQLVEIF